MITCSCQKQVWFAGPRHLNRLTAVQTNNAGTYIGISLVLARQVIQLRLDTVRSVF